LCCWVDGGGLLAGLDTVPHGRRSLADWSSLRKGQTACRR
jgi:hypothetical protein